MKVGRIAFKPPSLSSLAVDDRCLRFKAGAFEERDDICTKRICLLHTPQMDPAYAAKHDKER